MTFLISWFIVLMQFLWKYVEELVGKGLGVDVIAQTVFYAAMSLVPLAMALGVLFASIMYFGNMGERLELLAMKASGISLYRIMRPLVVTVVSLAVGLFFFQNTYMITSQVRMWTIILSARQASPELEIPEGAFYDGIPGYSIYVSKRDRVHKGRMHDIMLYDYKQGANGVRIITADSGRIVMDAGQTYLTWRLYNGQSFENLSRPTYTQDPQPSSYAKERFAYKEILINFDANFKQGDEADMQKLFVGKNLVELERAIDTASRHIDSLRGELSGGVLQTQVRERYSYQMPALLDTAQWAVEQREALLGSGTLVYDRSVDSILVGRSLVDSLSIVGRAVQKVENQRMEAEVKLEMDKSAYYSVRTNTQEWHRKFTFPAACIVFFFIGAPMGAIIRKGGLGMPIVLSVLFFIIYYVIDTFGHNMVRGENMSVQLGMWLSTLVLAPVGIVLTIQASRDSATMNVDAYALFFRRLLGMDRVRKVEPRDNVFSSVDYSLALERIRSLRERSQALQDYSIMSGRGWLSAEAVSQANDLLKGISLDLDTLVEDLSLSQEIMVVATLKDLPILPRSLSRTLPMKYPRVVPTYIILMTLLTLSGYLWLLHARRRAIVRALAVLVPQLTTLETYILERQA